MDINYPTIAPRTVLSRHFVTSLSTIGEAMMVHVPALYQYLASTDHEPAGPEIAIYPDEEFNPEQFNCEVAVPVAAPFPVTDPYVIKGLPGGTVATYLHVGNYDQLHTAWTEFIDQVTKSGKQVGMPVWEEYLNDCTTLPPEQWETLLVCPVQ